MSEQRVIILDGSEQPTRDLIGGKAWSVARMMSLGLRVPPAFVLPVGECRRYLDADRAIDDELWQQVLDGVANLEQRADRRFGDPNAPLLVSVRSGAAVSMPGMMDTVLNLGITDDIEAALAELTGDPEYARDTHARFLHAYGDIVLKADLDSYVSGPTADEMRAAVLKDTGKEVPTTPLEQLRGAISAVFDSWNSSRAKAYRKHWGIAEAGGTAVTVQMMVFGNLGEASGTGVLFTRNPLSGEPEPYGEWLPGGQGDDVVGGTHTVQDMITLKNDQPAVHEELLTWAQTLEREHSEVQDIEFTMEQGRLYLLQTRTAKRSPQAAVRIAVDLVDEGVITPDDAIARVTPEQMRNVMSPRLDPQHSEQHRVASGEPACPGVATGIGVVDPDEAEARSRAGESIVLVRPTTSPNDVHGMIAAVAVVTDLGGSTSHAAVVTRALGRPSVVGVGDGVAESLAGKVITVDGEGGHVYEGEMPLLQTRVDEDPRLSRFAAWAAERSPLNVIEAAPDGVEFVDLDALGLGVATDHHHTTPSRDEITAALQGASMARGTLLSTPDGVAAAIAAGVTTVVAKPALPVQLMAARQALDLA